MTSLDQIERQGTDATDLRVGISETTDTHRAIHELLDELRADTAELTLVFFSSGHDADTISSALDDRVGARGVAGSTGGELSARGFTRGTITGMSLHAPGVRAATEVIPNLDDLSLVPLVHLPDQLAGRLGRERDELDPDRHAWLLFADGHSGAEDLVTPFFMQGAPTTQLVGGSLTNERPTDPGRAIHHGRVYENAALLILLEYEGPFELFHHCHLELTDRRFEVTAVSDNGRVLEELDGNPAAEVYADALEVSPDELRPDLYPRRPFGFPFRGRPHVCAPIEHLSRGRLKMANTIHPGDELRLLEGGDLVASTENAVSDALADFEREHHVAPRGALMFHCLGRYFDARARGVETDLADAINQLPLAGFNTNGEQFNTLHTNMTLTGLLFG